MGLFSGLIGFAVHSVAVLAGARVAKVSRIDFWKAAVVALLSYIVIALPLMLFGWIPVLGKLLGLLILGGGTAVATKLIWDIEWKSAYTIGIVVTIIYIIVSLLPIQFGLFRLA